MEVHPYFRHSRNRHPEVTEEVARRVRRQRRVWVYIQRDGRVRYYGYSPELGTWVRVVTTADGKLFNGFEDENAREHVRLIGAGRGGDLERDQD